MKEDEAYLEIATRYIQSCDGHMAHGINIQEVIGFKAYHAFESLGGAFNSHYGHNVPKGHVTKINTFVTNSRHSMQLKSHNVAVVAMLLTSMRNKYLYPESIGGTFKNPKDQISLTDAKKMVSRVRGIMKGVAKIVRQ